ncbi:hypothetical protein GCM10028771_09080 [Nocardioides marmoraquaticus]
MRARGLTPRSGPSAPALRTAVARAVLLLGVVGGLLVAPLANQPAGAAVAPDDDAEATPLTVRLSAMSPAVVQPRGSLVLAGSVRNDSDEVWTDVNVAPFVGDAPITSRAELGLAADTPEETTVGSRLDAPGTFVGVGDLVPGEELDFRLTVPRTELPPASAPGVYWVGAHALGTSSQGRDGVADGRARTFVPVLPETAASTSGRGVTVERDGGTTAAADQRQAAADAVPVSLVLPLRETALRGSDGSLLDPARWVEVSGVDGRLDRISRFAATADDRPLGWLLDPGVIDALSDLGQGNPPLSLGPRERVSGPAEPSPSEPDSSSGSSAGSPSDAPSGSATASPSGSGSGSPSGSPSVQDPPDDDVLAQQPAPDDPEATDDLGDSGVPDQAAAAAARALLDRLLGQLDDGSVLALPYADADAMALARTAPGMLDRAVAQTRATLDVRGLEGRPVLAPPTGRIDPTVLDDVPTDVGLLASDRGDLDGPVSGRVDDRDLLLADARVGRGGPEPTPALDPLALRQRLVAETWLESTTASDAGTDPRPLVVALPSGWDPGADWASSDFFDALDVPWLRWEAPPTSDESVDDALSYPRSTATREVSATAVAAARELARSGGVLHDLLANDNDVLPRVDGAALQTVSYGARARPRRALDSATGLTRTLQDDLSRVSILGTDFFTLSSGSGTVTITVVNGLSQPVTVGIGARADAGVEVGPVEPLALGPEQRGTVRVPVSSDQGVHDVGLVPVTAGGEPAGTPFDFVLRTSQVGRTVWYVMAGGAALFLVTLLRRLWLRMRDGRRLRTRATQAREEGA